MLEESPIFPAESPQEDAWEGFIPARHYGPSGPGSYWTEYILTKNGDDSKIQSIYSDGGGATEQVYLLNFDRIAVYHYFG